MDVAKFTTMVVMKKEAIKFVVIIVLGKRLLEMWGLAQVEYTSFPWIILKTIGMFNIFQKDWSFNCFKFLYYFHLGKWWA